MLPLWTNLCRTNSLTANIRLNCAKKIPYLRAFSAQWGPAVQIPSAPPSSPSVFGPIGESLEIRACARDLRSCMDPENALGSRIRRIQQNLSGRDLARSMDHRRKFACSWNPANRRDEGRRVRRTPWLRPEDHVYDATRESSLGFKPQPLRLRFIVCFVHLPTLTVFEVKRSGLEVMKVSDQRRRAEGPA